LTDPTPATKRTFSAVVKRGRYTTLRNLTITNDKLGNVANHSNDDDGVLGDAWDVGVYCLNSDHHLDDSITVEGNFRIAAKLVVSAYSGEAETGFNGKAINNQNLSVNSLYGGHTGVMIRGVDAHRVISVRSAGFEIDIPWTPGHMFPSGEGFLSPATAGDSKYKYNYVTRNSTGTRLIFHMETDPTVWCSVGMPISDGRDASYGFDGTRYVACRIRGTLSNWLNTSTKHDFDRSGMCLQIHSGSNVRGVDFIGCTIDTGQDVMAFLHGAGDIYFQNCYFEGKGAKASETGGVITKVPGGGSWWIASDGVDNNNALAATGGAKVTFTNCQWANETISRFGAYTMGSDLSNRHKGCTTGLFNPMSVADTERGIVNKSVRFRTSYDIYDNDANALRWSFAGSNLVPAANGVSKLGDGGGHALWGVYSQRILSDGSIEFYTSGAVRLTINGDAITPRGDGNTTLGSAAGRLADVASKKFTLASGVSVFSGTGSPEAVTTASPGSFYLQTDATGITQPWFKATGTTSAGWVRLAKQPRSGSQANLNTTDGGGQYNGEIAYSTNARMLTSAGALEASGAGSGGLVFWHSTAGQWRVLGTNIQAVG
jgi:hypothetical protein